MVNLEVLNPVAPIVKKGKARRLAARLSDLGGKTIGLFWNGKASGDILNGVAGELLASRFPGIRLREYIGSTGMGIKPSYIRRATGEILDTMAKECDAVIGALGD